MLFNPSLDVKAKLGRLSNYFLARPLSLYSFAGMSMFSLSGFRPRGGSKLPSVVWSWRGEAEEQCCCLPGEVLLSSIFSIQWNGEDGALRVPLSVPADTLSSMWIPADGCHDKHWGDFSWELHPATSTRGLRLNLKAHLRLENHFSAVSRNLDSIYIEAS